MIKLVGLLAAVLFLAGCSVPTLQKLTHHVTDQEAYGCALLVEQGLSSYSPVTGSYQCFSKGYQNFLSSSHSVTDDQSLATWVHGYTSYTVVSCGIMIKPDSTHDAFLFSTTSAIDAYGEDTKGQWVDDDLLYVSLVTGKVDALQEAGISRNFDIPLAHNPTCEEGKSLKWPKPQYTD